jgi:hypothetical protein
MRTKTIFFVLAALAAWTPAARAQLRGTGYSPLSPAQVGTRLEAVIECGFGYRPHEKYDVKLTLLEVLRGDRALERIKAASASNKPPNAGLEYILVHIRFEFYAKGAPGDCVHELRGEEFTAFSADGQQYEAAMITPPQPGLSAKLHSGDSFDGWLAFQAPQGGNKALLRFVASVGSAVEQGGQVWFQLY